MEFGSLEMKSGRQVQFGEQTLYCLHQSAFISRNYNTLSSPSPISFTLQACMKTMSSRENVCWLVKQCIRIFTERCVK